MQDLTGHSIGRYHILEPLGQGGMASVYKAFDTRLEAEVAVKVIRTDMFPPAVLERMLKRFEREAKAVARLNHPNIVSVIDYGEYEGFPYLVMKYMPGGTLKAHMGQPMPYNQAARLLAPIARALAYAHGQGVLHRDVKPANILITQSGEPVLTDFGIAKLVENEKGQTLTGTGMGIGTPEYMAPEQGLAQEVDGRADVYALGVVFYELVTGRRPFMADTPMAVLLKQVNDPLPRPKDFVSALPKDAEQVILKALAKNPADRYGDMSAFAAALEKLAAGSTQQDSQTMLQRNQKKPTAQNMPAEAETCDQMDTGTLSGPSSRAPHNGKGKWLLVGLAAVALIGAGVYFGILRQNQPAAGQSEPVVVTQVVTPEPIVRVVEPTQNLTPTQTLSPISILSKDTLPPNATYLGDMAPISVEIGYGVYSVGKFNFNSPEDFVTAGMPLAYKNETFDKGIYAHAPSRIKFLLEGNYSTLNTYIFIDSKCRSEDGVIFRIIADEKEIFASSTVTSSDYPQQVEVQINQANTLTLITDPGLKLDRDCDWAIWGNPYLVKKIDP